MNDPKQFFREGRAAGCPQDQLFAFASKGIWLQPRQLAASAAARQCDDPNGPTAVGYGGARGGGKSHWLLAQVGGDDCQRVAGLKCLLLRKVGKANLESFEDLRRRVFPKLPHIYTSSRGHLTFENGSRVIAGHFQNESDIDAYLGLEYDVIGIEEATTLTWRKYQNIRTCLRTSKPNWRPRIYCTTNPGGIGHAWFRREFIDPHNLNHNHTLNLNRSAGGASSVEPATSLLPRGEGQDEGQTSNSMSSPSTLFIPATVSDNRFINPEYKNVLERLSGWQKRAWLHGDWDIAAGQFFTTFRRDVHVVSDFDESRAVEWFAALDYGYTHYTVFLLGCKDGDGNLYIVDEHAERFWLPERHSLAIRQMLHRHMLFPEKLRWIVAGTDCFSAQHDGTTIAQQYAKFGLKLRAANTDRVHGWAEMLRLLGDPDAGLKPRLFIHQRCARLIECLPNLQHDPHRPEDILKVDVDEDGHGGDDTADAARYLVHYKPAVLRQVKLTGW
jgi:phage terminase large subunit